MARHRPRLGIQGLSAAAFSSRSAISTYFAATSSILCFADAWPNVEERAGLGWQCPAFEDHTDLARSSLRKLRPHHKPYQNTLPPDRPLSSNRSVSIPLLNSIYEAHGAAYGTSLSCQYRRTTCHAPAQMWQPVRRLLRASATSLRSGIGQHSPHRGIADPASTRR